MSIDAALNYFATYGLTLLFIIVFLEYLNLPGLPAGVIMPAAGILAAKNNISLPEIIFISLIAGILGSIVLYIIGYYGGAILLEKIAKKYPKTQNTIDKTGAILRERGSFGLFLCRLIPVLRTIVSIIAGAVRVKFGKFLLYSTAGIFIWNLCFIFAGYFFGDILFK